jgi:hypothetical protein
MEAQSSSISNTAHEPSKSLTPTGGEGLLNYLFHTAWSFFVKTPLAACEKLVSIMFNPFYNILGLPRPLSFAPEALKISYAYFLLRLITVALFPLAVATRLSLSMIFRLYPAATIRAPDTPDWLTRMFGFETSTIHNISGQELSLEFTSNNGLFVFRVEMMKPGAEKAIHMTPQKRSHEHHDARNKKGGKGKGKGRDTVSHRKFKQQGGNESDDANPRKKVAIECKTEDLKLNFSNEQMAEAVGNWNALPAKIEQEERDRVNRIRADRRDESHSEPVVPVHIPELVTVEDDENRD